MKVTGLVLTIGEESTDRAIDALKGQSTACENIVVVKDVTPFHKAMNEGVSRIETPFFLQCDADMIPDPDCIETMLKFAADDVGVVIGYLQDELLGKIQAIKLFRTECVRDIQFADHISPDTDYLEKMAQKGWRHVFASRGESRYEHEHDVLGAHDPNYTSLYTYSKFKLEGARMRERGVFTEFLGYIRTLSQSEHPMAPIALTGICKGIVSDLSGDGLGKYEGSQDFKLLDDYFRSQKVTHDFMISPEATRPYAETTY